MDLRDQTLEDWLKKKKHKAKFPSFGDVDYNMRYQSIKERLKNHVHKHVTAIASTTDGGLYTDHDIGHVENVIRKASELVKAKSFQISPYEAYLLLTAIQLHDVGHIKAGRHRHELNLKEVMKDLGELMGPEADNIEKRWIYQIAQAHGGLNVLGNKDKIGELPDEELILGFPVRFQLLAALLRLADELADDRRSAEYHVRHDRIPKQSEIYHYYSQSLHSVKVNHERKLFELHFYLNKENVSRVYGKGEEEVFLLDEIYERTLKTYFECIYCMRFFPSELQIRSVKVSIDFFDKIEKIDSDDSWRPFYDSIKYTLMEKGYPDIGEKKIFDLCPDELKKSGDDLTGQKLKEIVEKNIKGKNNDCA